MPKFDWLAKYQNPFQGVAHEHNRPDRDTYLNVNFDASTKGDQYFLVETQNWLDTGQSQIESFNDGHRSDIEKMNLLRYRISI